ncbi:MAG TPA: glycosyltransferase family 4 protein, partial [Candidatus Nitrosocosmicus sp.]|nr:glycosyltransferase family 4 protein [Candidatus Nitrosocosmicus sp.]
KYIDHFICPTELSKKALTAEGCDEKKISVIPLGVDLTKFKPSNSFTSQAIKLLFVGRLEVEKGIFDLLKSFIRLKKKVPKLVLTIIGAGSKKKMIYKFINHHNLLRFVTIKNISYSQIHTLYNTSDIFVLPSKPTKYWQEQYGMVLLEAMASGLPIVTTNTGAIPEVVGNAALLCKPGDVAELTQSIYKLICDESLRKDLSIKALERAVTRYDSRRTGKKIIKLMNKVLTS